MEISTTKDLSMTIGCKTLRTWRPQIILCKNPQGSFDTRQHKNPLGPLSKAWHNNTKTQELLRNIWHNHSWRLNNTEPWGWNTTRTFVNNTMEDLLKTIWQTLWVYTKQNNPGPWGLHNARTLASKDVKRDLLRAIQHLKPWPPYNTRTLQHHTILWQEPLSTIGQEPSRTIQHSDKNPWAQWDSRNCQDHTTQDPYRTLWC
jgi:hypothetical protein